MVQLVTAVLWATQGTRDAGVQAAVYLQRPGFPPVEWGEARTSGFYEVLASLLGLVLTVSSERPRFLPFSCPAAHRVKQDFAGACLPAADQTL